MNIITKKHKNFNEHEHEASIESHVVHWERRQLQARKSPSKKRNSFQGQPYNVLSANLMIELEKSLKDELENVVNTKLAKLKKIEQLKDEVKRDENREESLKSKISQIKMNRIVLQNRLDKN